MVNLFDSFAARTERDRVQREAEGEKEKHAPEHKLVRLLFLFKKVYDTICANRLCGSFRGSAEGESGEGGAVAAGAG